MTIGFLFQNINDYLALFQKKTYEKAFERFQETQAKQWFEMLDEAYALEPDVAKLCESAANDLVQTVQSVKSNTKFRNRNDEAQWQGGINLFIVAYVIPAIFELRNDYYKELPKYICMAWVKAFPDSKILPGTFETIKSGFAGKPFGLR